MDDLTATNELLTFEDAAERADVHLRTIRRWVRAGLLPVTLAAGTARPRIDSSDLHALMVQRAARVWGQRDE